MHRPSVLTYTLPLATDCRARLTGIGLICLALFCFTLLDTTAKWLSGRMDTMQVIWVRFAGHFLLAFLFVNPWTVPGLLRPRRLRLQLVRSALLMGGTGFNFAALRFLQLDETSAILFTTPLLVAALAGPVLGEWLDWRRWIAIGIGFAGVVLLVTRPGTGGVHPAAILSLVSAGCLAFYSITTRMLAAHDAAETTSFYSSLVGLIVMAVPAFWTWTPPADVSTMAGMIAVGAFGWLGHWILIVAHRHAPAPVLAPFSYTQMIWMTLSGALVFGDLPNRWTLAGAAVVILSGLYLLSREHNQAA